MNIKYGALVVLTITYNFLQMIVLVNRIPLKPERITRLENYDHGQFVNGHSFPNVSLALATRLFSLQVRSFGKSCRLLSTLQVLHT